jgi:hypothetical protein
VEDCASNFKGLMDSARAETLLSTGRLGATAAINSSVGPQTLIETASAEGSTLSKIQKQFSSVPVSFQIKTLPSKNVIPSRRKFLQGKNRKTAHIKLRKAIEKFRNNLQDQMVEQHRNSFMDKPI